MSTEQARMPYPNQDILLWERLKLNAQVISYGGTIISTWLAIYAVIRQRTLPTASLSERVKLNQAGKRYVIGLAIVALLTVASTIAKDVADAKLASLAKKIAQREIRDTLGSSLGEFADKQLAPSIIKLQETIDDSTQKLNKNLDSSIERFHGATTDAIRDVVLNAAENSQEIESASIPIRSLSVALSVKTTARRRYSPEQRSWQNLFDEQCKGLANTDATRNQHCIEMKSVLDNYALLSDFLNAIDPNDHAESILIRINLSTFNLYFYFSRCEMCLDPLTRAHHFPSINIDELVHNESFRRSPFHLSLSQGSSNVGEAVLWFEETLSDKTHSYLYPQETGADADLDNIEIIEWTKKVRTDISFPRTIDVTVILKPTHIPSEDVVRTYILKRSSDPLGYLTDRAMVKYSR
jgi:hypothetical protein